MTIQIRDAELAVDGALQQSMQPFAAVFAGAVTGGPVSVDGAINRAMGLFTSSFQGSAQSTIPPANFIIPLGVTTWDGGSTGFDVQPGQIIEFEAGVRNIGSFSIENLQGSTAQPIIVRNDPFASEPAVFEHNANAFEFFRFLDCEDFIMDGTLKYVGAPDGEVGITVTGNVWVEGRTQAGIIIRQETGNTNPPDGYIKIAGSTQKFTLRGFEIDGKEVITGSRSGIGVQAHDRFRYQKNLQYDLLWREGMILEKHFIHGTKHEGIYLGNNWANSSSELDADPRNCHIRYAIYDDTGWTGAQIKGAWDDSQGVSSIHHCASYRCGQVAGGDADAAHANGFQTTGSNCDVYNCVSIEAGGPGIATRVQQMDVGTGNLECNYNVYNNVVVRNGRNNGNPSGQELAPGILAWHTPNTINSNTGNTLCDNITLGYNNTVIDGDQTSMRTVGSTLTATDNICAGDGAGGAGSLSATANGVWGGILTSTNNLGNTIAANDFEAEASDDYRLTDSSIARDGGGSPGFPAFDHVDHIRPQGLDACQGAYEFPQRNLLAEHTYARGYVTSATNPDADGVFRDFGFVFGAEPWDNPITITNISNANPAIATYTGSMPDVGNGPPLSTLPPGFTLGTISSGMTELSGRLIRPKNITGSTFECWQDGDDTGYNPDSRSNDIDDLKGNTSVNATGYGSWSGSVQAQAYRRYDNRTVQWDVLGADYPNVGVTTSAMPPDTINGPASGPVGPLEGVNFLSHQINYWIDHSRDPNRTDGVWQPQNKPRNQLIANDQDTQIADGDTIWFGFSIHLPDNFDNTTNTRTGDLGETQLFSCKNGALGGQGTLAAVLITAHGSVTTGTLAWVMDADLTGDGVGGTTEDIFLDQVASDIGMWTSFVMKMHRHPSNGVLQVWKSTGPYIGATQDREMTQVYSRVGQPVGQPPNLEPGWGFTICRQYKHAWHHWTDNGDSYEQWMGFDSIRWGGEQSHGTTFVDVHPFLRAEPSLVDHVIPTSTGTWDGIANNVQPGDVIEIEGGTRGALRLNNIVGTAANPVEIRSDASQQVVIANSPARSGFFTFTIDDSQHWILNGNATVGETYGFLITTLDSGDAPSAYLQLWGTCRDYEIKNIDIDGKWTADGNGLGQGGIGIQHNDANIGVGTMWRENLHVHHNRVRNVKGEGIYMGPNYVNFAADLRNVEVNNNIVWDCGRDCMNLKCMIDGTNLRPHNDLRRSGLRLDEFQGAQQDGIAIFEGYATIYNNYIEDAGEVAIRMNTFNRPDTDGPYPVQDIYNNVIWKTGIASTPVSQPGDGIRVGVGTNMAQVGANCYQNTIVTTESHGIWHTGNVLAADVRDNIAADIGGTDYNTPGQVTETNNWSGTIAAQNFDDAPVGDFHLTATSPSRNNGSASGFPADDFDGVSRPLGTDADQGAFEYVE